MSICRFCLTKVLESGQAWDYHHQEPIEFQAAAASGCAFCARLADGLGEIQSWFHHEDEIKSLYRWNLRHSAQIRETKSYVSITFRPVPGRISGGRKSDDLPEVRFALFPEQDLGFIPDERELGPSTSSPQAQSQMKSWLDTCLTSHPNCARRHTSRDFIPTRVLDVGTTTSPWPPAYIRVVDTNEEHVTGAYMTLSHCWGKGSFVRLTDDDVAEYRARGIPWAAISSNVNFAQAVETTRVLGVRYLWIDSVCIIQGQAHGGDWHAEAPLMHKVYRNSFCNLAAAVSKDHEGGLFRERAGRVMPVRYTPERSSATFGGRTWRILPSDLWDKDLLGSHLYTRGWAFQERMLSPRLLQFGKSQLFWDCATLSACEALPSGLPAPLDMTARADRHWRRRLQDSGLTVRSLVSTAGDSLEEFWKSAVRAYTGCDLTKHDDKIKALWGIAKLVRDALGEEYAAGLWSNSVEEQLAWRVVDCRESEHPEDVKEHFPSWSWTALKGSIEVADRVPAVERFYSARNHGGGDVKFQFKKALWGRVEGEYAADWSDEVKNMRRKLDESTRRRAKNRTVVAIVPIEEEPAATKDQAPAKDTVQGSEGKTKPHPSDVASELKSHEIAIQGHICQGALRGSAEGEWAVSIDGLEQEDAFIEAHPDMTPPQEDGPCNLLLLAASKVFVDEWGDCHSDDGYLEEEEIEEVLYSGVGILIEHVEKDRYKRVGAVTFRQLNRESWGHLRRACGKGDEGLENELDVRDGQKIWLV